VSALTNLRSSPKLLLLHSFMNRNHKNWTLSLGIITATVIVLSQLFWFQTADFSKKKAATEQTEDANQQEVAHISLPSPSIPTGTSVEQGQKSSFIQVLLFEEGKDSEIPTSLPTVVGKFFKTLFRVLIAPNAP
jgi:hypothetical protein